MARVALDQQLVARVKELKKDISVLGDEELKELKRDRKSEGEKRKKLVEFLQGLEKDE